MLHFTTSPIEDVAVQDKINELRLGPMTRSRTKLLEQQVNSLLVEYDIFNDENFILSKSMHLCMIRFVHNTNANGGKHQDMEENSLEHGENMKTHDENNFLHEENIQVWKTSIHMFSIINQLRKHEEGAPLNIDVP